MAASNYTTADKVLKEFYLPGAQEQLNNMHVLLTMVESGSKNVEGRRAVLLAHTSRNSGIGARAEGGTLPTPGAQGYQEERVPVVYNYGRGSISGPLMAAATSDKGSFQRQMKAEMDGLVTDIKNDYSRQIYNDDTRTLAQCGVTSASATVVLTTPTDVELRLLEQGGRIDIGTAGSPASVVSAAVIQSVDVANGTVTIDSAITTTSSHFITRSGSLRVNEITGIRQIVNEGDTLFNIDGSAVSAWNSYVDDNSGTNRAVTERMFSKAIEQIHIKSGKAPNLLMTSHGVRGAMADLLDSQKRFSNTIELKAGFSAVTVSAANVEVPMVVDNFAPSNTAFLVCTPEIQHHVMGTAWSWMNEDGAVLSRLANEDGYEFTIKQYSELTTNRRNAHGRINDITEA